MKKPFKYQKPEEGSVLESQQMKDLKVDLNRRQGKMILYYGPSGIGIYFLFD